MCLNHPELVHKHPAHLVSHRNSSNLHEPQHHRNSKVCRGLSPAFRVVRLYQTFTMYVVTGETRSAGCLCNSSGWFKHSEPHQTSSNHNLFGVVQAQRTASNLHEPHHHRDCKVCRGLSQEVGVVRLYRTFSMYIVTWETRSAGCLCNSSGWFKHSEPQRTFSNHNITEIARCGEVCHMSSGRFDCTEPSLSTSLQGKQGVHGAYALVQGGSSTSNHFFTEIARCAFEDV